MMSIYAKNHAALSLVNQQLAAYLTEINSDKYRVVLSLSGEPSLKISSADGREVTIGDQHDQVNHARSLIPQINKDAPLFIMMGIGLGHVFFETRKKYPKAVIVVIEADAHIFKKALETFDYTQAIRDPHVIFCVSLKPERLLWDLYTYLTQPEHSRATPLLTLIQDGAITKYAHKYYVNAAKIVKEAIDQLWDAYIGNDATDSYACAKNVMQNVSKLEDQLSIEPYRGLFKNKIGIVVSSGPSLDNKIAELKQIQDKAVIICADSALRKILASGIKPFGVVSLERDEYIPDMYKGYAIPEDIILFYIPQVLPEVLRIFLGPKCPYFKETFPFNVLPTLIPRTNMGSSCAHLALMILIAFGCREIGLVGQDLAYDRKSGVSHFSGVGREIQDCDTKLDRVMVEDNQGGTIETHMYWSLFRDQFKLIINHNPQIKVFNVIEKECGAKIDGSERIDATDFFSRFNDVKSEPAKLDIKIGKIWLAERLQGFKDNLEELKSILKSELPLLRERYAELNQAADFEQFYVLRESVHAAYSSQCRLIFSTYFISVLRRFDAAAASLWTVVEFIEHRDEHVKQCQGAMNDLLELLS